MVKNFPSNSMLSLLSVAVLIAGSLSIGQALSAQAKELSYDEALRALQQTKQHSKAAERWGEKRTLTVPVGQDPNQLIKKEVLKVPGVLGIDGPVTPKSAQPIKVNVPVKQNSAKAKAPAPVPVSTNPKQTTKITQQAGGWDWVSSNDTVAKKQTAPQAPVPTQNNQATGPAAKQPTMANQTGFHEVNKSSLQTTYEAPVVEKPAAVKKVVEKTAPKKASDDILGITGADTPATTKAANEQTAVAREPRESATELYNRAVKAHLSGKLSEAIADYSSALRKDPKLANAHCNLGQIYNQQHHFDMAIAEFRKALAINPKDEHSYNGIGASLRGKKDYEGAIKNWQMAVSLKPDLATAHYNLGAVYEVQNEMDKAILSYEKAVKNDYRLGEANYRIGLILSRKKRFDEAKEQFKQALKVSGKASYSEDARKRLAWIEEKTH